MEYIITNIKGDYEAQFGKRRVVFTVEGNEKDISGFFKFVPKVGDSLTGEIVPNGNYLNFKFGGKTSSSAPAGDLNRVEMKIDRVLAGLQTLGGEVTGMKGVMGDILQKIDPAIKNDAF